MTNRLSSSTSPYLLQHADNPVHWWEWGEEAFAEAKSKNLPVLLSVGYSACHWCHVMAHESFEDPNTARIMNGLFVNIKVDREERPDIDSIYMEACQMLTGRGGWPLTVFMNPDGEPFYAGTYYPPQPRGGMPSFPQVLGAVSQAWQERKGEVAEQASKLSSLIGRRIPSGENLPDAEQLEQAYRQIHSTFDPVHGGFGRAPKFPQQPLLEFLLAVLEEPWAKTAGSMLGLTLERMAAGGIFDQLGGGFARYSVDERWLVPHFEKMLYDNATLARICLWAAKRLGEPALLDVASQTLDYLVRDMRNPEGGFYSAEDADSEGVEGLFYVWSLQQIMDVAGPVDGPEVADWFGVTEEGNFEGANILTRRNALAPTPDSVAPVKERLLEVRSRRARPGLDYKLVAGWNGLAIRAFAEAGAVLGRDDYLCEARAAARFVLHHMQDGSGRLSRVWTRGRRGGPGYLEDYGGAATGLFALYQATGEEVWYEEAASLTRAITRLFKDPSGGFFATGADAERLISRPKDVMDNPSPSGNSLAAEALLTLGQYTGDTRWWELAEEAVRDGVLLMERAPSATGSLLAVARALDAGPREVALVGPEATRWAGEIQAGGRPGLVIAFTDTADGGYSGAVPLLENRGAAGETLAYVCHRFTCDAPVDNLSDLKKALEA
ncbi:MAG: thioredoxin domain-containing protein [bacterium]|nr:thioredoxin domain-containing protein [Acidimicrobiia bacterium]MCY4650075.1 thioredoxin domain-containing protein [bacterium]